MASRLALKYGLVSEEDRLSSSSDALLVTEPTTGSKARTKGSIYLIVTSRATGGRTREACRLVADTIRREYYYDESAGIAIVLEKAIRAANRRLRHAREGSGLAEGSIGVAVAVVRGNELYVATCGGADSYLIRSARLLMPEHEAGGGVPAADALRVDVWRGDLSVGDSLVLCSRNLVEVVGTEELKNAVVTLHPQSAVEHLHHLFVAAGGEGSDAVLAIEATEVALSRVEHRLVPVSPSEPLAGAPTRSPIPLADQFAGAASAVQDRAVAARSIIRDSFSRAVGRVLDVMPRRRTPYRRITPATSRRETQRRAAIAVLAVIAVVGVLGVGLWYWGPLRPERPIDQVNEGEAAFAAAEASAAEVFGPADLVESDPDNARRLLRSAWADLNRAGTADVDPQAVAQLRGRVAVGLDRLYATVGVSSTPIYSAPAGGEIEGLVRGPDNAAYVIVERTVVRIDPETASAVTIVSAGDGSGEGMDDPRLLARGGPDLLIVDIGGALWRWRPSGTLLPIRVAGGQSWDEIVDFETFLIDPDQGLYRIYLPHPSTSQILRYDLAADGGGFGAPTPYFVGESEDVAAFRQLLIDGDVYAATSATVLRYFNGRRTGYEPATPPDDGDLRPGHDYRYIAATGTRGVGRLFIWDSLHARILAFDKTEGSYLAQFMAAPGEPELTDMRGMFVIDRGEVQPPIVFWANGGSVFQTILAEEAEEPGVSPTPTAEVTPPPATATPAGPTIAPTERPRRTPRATQQPPPPSP